MVYELVNKHEFKNVAKIISNSEQNNNTFAHSVAEGNTLGWIFVDDKKFPTSAMIWPKLIECGEVIFIGNHLNHDFNQYVPMFVDEELKPRMIKLGIKYFECYGDNSYWNDTFQKIFKSHRIYIENMLRYHFTGTEQKLSPMLPHNYRIVPIEESLLCDTEIINKETLSSQIRFSWGSIENFIQLGYGYVIIHDSTIIGWCYVCSRYGKYVQYDVEIAEQYWNKKLGTIVSKYLINESILRDDVPEWQVSEETIASQKIASNIGFTYNSIYPVFQIKLLDLSLNDAINM